MRVDIRGDNVNVPRHTRYEIESRCRIALGRIVAEIAEVVIVFRDVNGPRGGMDIECRVDLRTRRGAEIRVEAVDALVQRAAARAIEHTARAAHRLIARQRELGRESVRLTAVEGTF